MPEAHIQWIGSSARSCQGQPDTHFGWYRKDDGDAIIVKRLNPAAHPHAAILTEHERTIHAAMQAEQLPVPRIFDSEPGDLHTAFAGYSLKWIMEQGPAVLSATELCTLFIHICNRAAMIADAGFLNLDVSIANIVIPLEHGPEGGCLHLDKPTFIDCCNTIRRNGNSNRPLWIRASMIQIAPELSTLLNADQKALAENFAMHGLVLRSLPLITPTEFLRIREAYATYSAPQTLQEALDSECISPQLTVQYSLGMALKQMLQIQAARTVSDQYPVDALLKVATQMGAHSPEDRYESSDEAVEALERIFLANDTRSRFIYPPVKLEDIIYCAAPGSDPPEYQDPTVSTNTLHFPDTSTFLSEAPVRQYALQHTAFNSRRFAVPILGLCLVASFIFSGWRHNIDPISEQARLEQIQIRKLAKNLGTDPQKYENAVRDLNLHATRKGYSASSTVMLANKILESEIKHLHKEIAAGPSRETLPIRLVSGDLSAVREWRGIRYKAAALAAIGQARAKYWLNSCDWAAQTGQNAFRGQATNVALLH